jgi:hypothetical protein
MWQAATNTEGSTMPTAEEVAILRSVDGSEFALPGDSGSLVVAEDGSSAVGVLFAASRSGEYGWIIPMPCVIGAFGGLQLVGRHGLT